MPWIFAAVLVAVLVAAQQPFEGSADSAWWRVALVAGGMAIAPLAAAMLAARAAIQLRRNYAQRRAIERRLTRWRRAQTALWAAVALASIVGCQWGPLLRDEAVWRGATLSLVWLPLLLAPVVVPLVLSWAALDHVDRVRQWLSDRATTARAIGTAQPAPPTDRTLTDRTLTARPPVDGAHHAHRARRAAAHTCPPRAQTSRRGLGRALDDARLQLGPTLLPVVVLLAVDDLLSWALPAWHRGAAGWLPPAVTLLALIAAFPWLLRYTWRTTPLAAGHLRTRLEAEARRAGVRIGEILVWQTDGRVANAAVVGFVPRTRRVLLSDGLLAHLDESQVLAVFRHELGHLRHHHHALRLALLALPLCAWLAVFPPAQRGTARSTAARRPATRPRATQRPTAQRRPLHPWRSIESLPRGRRLR